MVLDRYFARKRKGHDDVVGEPNRYACRHRIVIGVLRHREGCGLEVRGRSGFRDRDSNEQSPQISGDAIGRVERRFVETGGDFSEHHPSPRGSRLALAAHDIQEGLAVRRGGGGQFAAEDGGNGRENLHLVLEMIWKPGLVSFDTPSKVALMRVVWPMPEPASSNDARRRWRVMELNLQSAVSTANSEGLLVLSYGLSVDYDGSREIGMLHPRIRS